MIYDDRSLNVQKLDKPFIFGMVSQERSMVWSTLGGLLATLTLLGLHPQVVWLVPLFWSGGVSITCSFVQIVPEIITYFSLLCHNGREKIKAVATLNRHSNDSHAMFGTIWMVSANTPPTLNTRSVFFLDANRHVNVDLVTHRPELNGVEVYWVAGNNEEQKVGELVTGQPSRLSSFESQTFIFKKDASVLKRIVTTDEAVQALVP